MCIFSVHTAAGGETTVDYYGDILQKVRDYVLLGQMSFSERYPISVDGDFNRDGMTDDADMACLLWTVLFPD